MPILVGPAGWSYPDWEGRVYPARKPAGFDPLRYLAPYVDVLEVNATFYAPPDARRVARWVERVADRPGLRFVVKLHRTFTHEPWTAERRAGAAAFRAGILPLAGAGRLAALLVQFPVTFRPDAEAIARLGRLRDLFPAERLVLELRHRAWYEADELAALGPLDVSLAHLDLPAASDHPPPEDHEPLGPVGYLRLHGRNRAAWFRAGAGRDERYDWLYGREDLEGIARRARAIASRRAETYLVTNNHFRGQAMANAIELKAILAGGPVPAPPPLVEAFPRLSEVTVPAGQLRLF